MNGLALRCPLTVELLDTWHVGTGRGEGQHLDAVVDRAADHLPQVPGRMLRGLLRDACECLHAWEHLPAAGAGSVANLFGTLTGATNAPGRSVSRPGVLSVSNARLPEAERELLMKEKPEVRAALFMSSFQTALDPETGAVKNGSLRGIELVVPLTLQAWLELDVNTAQDAKACWDTILKALPLVRAIGAHKTRGHGRARLSLGAARP
jgi:hypothetical protein